MPNASVLYRARLTPGGDRCGLRVANRAERSACPSTEDQPRTGEPGERDRPSEVVHPVVLRECHPEEVERRGRREVVPGRRCVRARQLGEAEELDSRSTARELLEALQGRRQRNGNREGREREVEAGEPERGQPEGEPEEPRDEPSDRERPHVLHAARDRPAELLVPGHQNRRRVSADRHERAVAERDLPRVAGEDVQAEERDQVDADVGVVPCLKSLMNCGRTARTRRRPRTR